MTTLSLSLASQHQASLDGSETSLRTCDHPPLTNSSTMGDPTSRRKAYRLKGVITRDSVLTWDMNHRSFCRQFPEWQAFLPGGTRESWKSYNEDQSRGIIIMKAGRDENTQETDEIETNKVRTALEDFLTCLGTYCPENFMFTVIKEATSYI